MINPSCEIYGIKLVVCRLEQLIDSIAQYLIKQ